MVRSSSFAAFVVVLALVATASAADPFDDLRGRVNAAYAAGDADALIELVPQALELRPGNPTVLYMLAYAHALARDPEGALTAMERTVARGLVPISVPAHSELFAPMRALSGYADLQSRIAALGAPHGQAVSRVCAGAPDTVPEGVAVASDGTMFVSSVRHGGVTLIAPDGKARRWSTPGGSTMGLHHVSDDSELWIAYARLPQFAGDASGSPGKTGVVRVDARDGGVLGTFPFDADGDRAFGDFTFLADGTLVATDSLGSGAYRLDRTTGEWRLLDGTAALRSPQGIVELGGDLFIADWRTGLYRYRPATDELERVDDGAGAPYGIDGLYRDGDSLLAVQNGITPNRVTRFTLTRDRRAVATAEILLMNHPDFDEPTLGVVSGDSFFVVANSHWNRFTPENTLPDALEPPCILEIPLSR